MTRRISLLVTTLLVGLCCGGSAFARVMFGPAPPPRTAQEMRSGWPLMLADLLPGVASPARAPVLARLKVAARLFPFSVVSLTMYGDAPVVVIRTSQKAAFSNARGLTAATRSVLRSIDPSLFTQPGVTPQSGSVYGGVFFEVRDERGVPFLIWEDGTRAGQVVTSAVWRTYPSYNVSGLVSPSDLPLCGSNDHRSKVSTAAAPCATP